jgi:hypothetical protein
VRALDGSEGEATRINQWNELAGFDNASRLCQNIAVVRAAFADEKRQQRKDAGW